MLPNSAEDTVVLLAQISQQLDGLSNGNLVPITAPLASFSPQSGTRQSSPTASAVWVNSLWFLSLVVSLFCALLATLQQRWARRYLQLTQPQVAIHKRARIRSFFANGVTRFYATVTVEAIPALLHVSVFLFMAGLIISLFSVHHTVAYVVLSATTVCSLVYTAITVMPVIYHDSPYTSPLSAPLWYVPRKTALAVLKTVYRVVDFYMSSVRGRECWPTPSLHKTFTSYRKLLSRDMTEAAHAAAARADSQLDAKAFGWTLDQLDEEGELVKFAAGIPGFSHSTKVEESVAILEMTPRSSYLHHHLSRHITVMLIRALKPGLLRVSKLLPESVREQRVKICMEALYYLPLAIEEILKLVAANHEDRKVVAGFSPILESVESFVMAERLSVTATTRVPLAVKIVAQCMATVTASRLQPNEQTLPILKRHLGIKEPEPHLFNQYLDPSDSRLLINLNQFLRKTARGVIVEAKKQQHIDIVILTVRLAKRLKFEHAAQELRDQFEGLRTGIQQHATGPPGKARENAEKLLSELSSLTIGAPHPPPSVPLPSVNAARVHTQPTNGRGTAATSTFAHPAQTSQIHSAQRPLQSVSQVPNDAYISIPISPMSEDGTFPLMPISPSL